MWPTHERTDRLELRNSYLDILTTKVWSFVSVSYRKYSLFSLNTLLLASEQTNQMFLLLLPLWLDFHCNVHLSSHGLEQLRWLSKVSMNWDWGFVLKFTFLNIFKVLKLIKRMKSGIISFISKKWEQKLEFYADIWLRKPLIFEFSAKYF